MTNIINYNQRYDMASQKLRFTGTFNGAMSLHASNFQLGGVKLLALVEMILVVIKFPFFVKSLSMLHAGNFIFTFSEESTERKQRMETDQFLSRPTLSQSGHSLPIKKVEYFPIFNICLFYPQNQVIEYREASATCSAEVFRMVSSSLCGLAILINVTFKLKARELRLTCHK